MQDARPASQEALRYLRAAIDSCVKVGEHRLPTVRQLSRAAGVSHVTMWKAVRELKAEGALTAWRGRGISIARTSAEQAPLVRPTAGSSLPKWRRLCSSVEHDLLGGVYAPGSLLPSAKELTERYGVCHRTLRRALAHVAEHGRLQVDRRGYRVPELASRRAGTGIVLFALGRDPGTLAVQTPLTQRLLRALHEECLRARLHLVVYTVDPADGGLHTLVAGGGPTEIPPWQQSWTTYLGFIVWRTGVPDQHLLGILQRLSIFRKPVAVLDESGGLSIPSTVSGRGLVTVFSVANSPRCGEQMGHYLMGLGHQRIAYISVDHDAGWSVRRLAGLMRAYESSGLTGAVAPFTLSRQAAVSGDATQGESTAASLLRDTALTTTIRERMRSSRAIRRLQEHLDRTAESLLLHERLRPLLQSALRDRATTAWVTSDGIALECLDFLEQRKVRVPQDLSLVGFGDTDEALAEKLTSFSHNPSAVVHAMVEHAISAGPRRGTPREPRLVEIDGFVAPRRTSGPPRSA